MEHCLDVVECSVEAGEIGERIAGRGEDGLRAAIVLTQTHARLLSPALASTTDPTADFPQLHRTLDNVRAALDDYAKREGLAA